MSIKALGEDYRVSHPDYIPEGQESLYPHIGGVFHDYIPEGADALTFQGYTDDANVTAEQRDEANANKGRVTRRGKKA